MRRNNLDIYANIIEVAEGGAKKTELVYKCNLNFKIIEKYINKLTEKNFIVKKEKYYYTTEDGRNFLHQYNTIIAPLKEEKEITAFS